MPDLTTPSATPGPVTGASKKSQQQMSIVDASKKKIDPVVRGRRGRPSQEDYMRRVKLLLRADLFKLNGCTEFTQLPGVRATAKLHNKRLLHEGLAIRILMDQAVDEIRSVGLACGTLLSQRIAIFLEIWYEEAGSVVEVSQRLNLSRSRVVHAIQPKALDLVARRFLELAWQVESAA